LQINPKKSPVYKKGAFFPKNLNRGVLNNTTKLPKKDRGAKNERMFY
jgi:hypothetical protein